MNKDQYLKQLSAHLKKLKGPEREEVLGDIAEYFDCAAREGENEETICGRLGDPKKLGREYWAQSCIARANVKASPGTMLRAFVSTAALGIIDFLYVAFVAVTGYIIISAFYITAVSVGLSGLAVLTAGAIWLSNLGAAAVVLTAFAGLALVCIGVLMFIGIMRLARVFKRGNMAFLNGISSRIRREKDE